jgi:hypothetical protein
MGIFNKLFGSNAPKERFTITNSEELLDRKMFWRIIKDSKDKSSGDYEQQQLELKKLLLKLTPNEIIAFDNRFRTYQNQASSWDIWGAAYIIQGGCSDDSFSDFQGWLIGQGEQIFEDAMEDVESLSKLHDTNEGDWEGLNFVSTDAFETLNKQEITSGIIIKYNVSGEEWDEEGNDLKLRFPKLWEQFQSS